MIKYSHLVQYIKENHINWDTDLFDVLRGFFSQYSPPEPPPPSSHDIPDNFMQVSTERFEEPEDGEYSVQDLLNLLST